MTYLSVRPRFLKCPTFIKSAIVLLGATLLSSLAPTNLALANSTSNSPMADGIYLYGEQSIAAQLGSAYMVFEVIGQRAVGGFYMPSSSFDCFSGDISASRLDLNVIDSYDQSIHPYSLAVQTQPTLVAGQAAPEFEIQGFTAIETLSKVDEHVLATCQAVQIDTI